MSAEDALVDRQVVVIESGFETAIVDGRSIGGGIGREPGPLLNLSTLVRRLRQRYPEPECPLTAVDFPAGYDRAGRSAEQGPHDTCQ